MLAILLIASLILLQSIEYFFIKGMPFRRQSLNASVLKEEEARVSMDSFKEIFDNYRIKLLFAIILINLFMVPILVWNRIWLFHKDIYVRESGRSQA